MSLVSEVQTLLDDADGVFWTDSHVYDACNEAQLYVWGETRHDIGTATFTVTANQEFASLPTTIYLPQRIVANNVEWFVTTYYELERDDRKWRAKSQAQPKWFVLHDIETLRLHPRPDDTYEYVLWGVNYPGTEIQSGTEDITAPKSLKRTVEFRAAAMIAQQTRPDLAELWNASYREHLAEFKRQLRNRHGHKIVRMRPSRRFTTRAHQGNLKVARNIGKDDILNG